MGVRRTASSAGRRPSLFFSISPPRPPSEKSRFYHRTLRERSSVLKIETARCRHLHLRSPTIFHCRGQMTKSHGPQSQILCIHTGQQHHSKLCYSSGILVPRRSRSIHLSSHRASAGLFCSSDFTRRTNCDRVQKCILRSSTSHAIHRFRKSQRVLSHR